MWSTDIKKAEEQITTNNVNQYTSYALFNTGAFFLFKLDLNTSE